MRPVVDPERIEANHFVQACQPEGKRVLEVGCGRGTLTYQYSNLPEISIGFDPALPELKFALEHEKITPYQPYFICAKGEAMPFPTEGFDIVVFASSLWWIEHEGMVHALREGWRVLKPGGMLIDQRPLSIESPVDIISNGISDFVGMLDMSPGARHDHAADHAITSLVTDDLFHELSTEQFQIACYWKNVRGMVGDLKKRWGEDVRWDKDLIQRAYGLFGKQHRKAQVKLVMTMKLTSYEKIGSI
jgi:SAM-dependent methyltransferase